MKRLFIGLATVGALADGACATSIVDRPADEIRRHLAELYTLVYHCSKEYNLRHNTVDLIWDIVELKTGKDPEEEDQKNLFIAEIDTLDATIVDKSQYCADTYRRFGPSGSVMQDVVYRK